MTSSPCEVVSLRFSYAFLSRRVPRRLSTLASSSPRPPSPPSPKCLCDAWIHDTSLSDGSTRRTARDSACSSTGRRSRPSRASSSSSPQPDRGNRSCCHSSPSPSPSWSPSPSSLLIEDSSLKLVY
ncbi:unnamed protein product, partial [Mesorhabditis belari]|uniref:Uncharacterized protein n=1 Tax=Mesorhabditis belari TaxID=2138241 RepID=A0AAF3EB29_9BILA